MPRTKSGDKSNKQVQAKDLPAEKNRAGKSPQSVPGSPQLSQALFTEVPSIHQLFTFVDSEEVRAQLSAISVAQIEEFLIPVVGKAPHPRFAQFAEYRLKLLEPYNISRELRRIEDLGIRKETLSVLLMAINLFPGLDYGSVKLFGDRRTRHKHAAALLAPIPTLKILLNSMGNLSDEFKRTSLASPARAISDLEFFSSFFVMGEKIYDFLGVNSFLELSKFGLASLAHATAGNYLDREVSAKGE